MNRSLRLLPFVARFAVVHAAPGDRTRVTIVSTTNLHGSILPLDYYTNRSANVGLAKAATLIRPPRGCRGGRIRRILRDLSFATPSPQRGNGSRTCARRSRVDVVVVAMHMGLEADLLTGRVNPGQVLMENAALAVATRGAGPRCDRHGAHAPRGAFVVCEPARCSRRRAGGATA